MTRPLSRLAVSSVQSHAVQVRRLAPRRAALRGSLLQSVSLSALLVAGAAGRAEANPFRSLGQALASHPSAAVTAAATGGGAAAAHAAGVGAANLSNAAARFRSLNVALQGAGTYTGPAIDNGIGSTGLQQAPGVSTSGTNSAAWSGASTTLTQTITKGITDVTVTQTKGVAYLSWSNFSVGAKTDLIFNQSAGGSLASSWVAINYVQASANPTTILGQIQAPGKIYILNANGILFGAGSQVNVGALVASTADIAQAQFTRDTNNEVTAFTLYGAQATTTTYAPSFQCSVSATCGGVTVQAGAEIQTPTPSGSNAGGYVLLLGSTVENDGIISTPRGQTVLAAGSNFFVEPGYSSSNTLATVIGSQVATSLNGTITGTGTTALGAVTNTGIIVADQGDITLVGHLVTQAGIILSTTTVDNRGTVHLLTDTSDTTASVVLTPGSITEVLPVDDGQTALDSVRATNISNSRIYNLARDATQVGPILNDFNTLPDQIGESRIEISTGGSVVLQGGALALAQGGQVAVGASSILLQNGSTIDVSGTNAQLPASENSLNVNPLVPYDLRDSGPNRTGGLEFANVYIDERTLVDVDIATSSGTLLNVYTQGGLLEVSGLLGLVPHGINEWSALGGQVTLQATSGSGTASAGGTVVISTGATINLTGGTVTYGAGEIPQSYVQAADGEIFNVNDAPGDLVYTKVYTGETFNHARWNIEDTFDNPLLTPSEIYEPTYTIGRDAGTLTVTAATGVLDGTVDAGVTQSPTQTAARPTVITDPFLLAQNVTPQAGVLLVGDYVGGFYGNPFTSSVYFGAPFSGGTGGTPPVITAVPDSLTGTISVDSAQLGNDGFSRISFSTAGSLTVATPITLADGGAITLSASAIAIDADITSHGGQITLTNLEPITAIQAITSNTGTTLVGTITVASGVTLDASGQWTNYALNPNNSTLAAFANAGSVTITGTGGVDLQAGSVIDVSSGGVLSQTGKLTTASGGSVNISADIVPTFFSTLDQFDPVTYDATILGYASGAGGTLSLSAPEVIVGAYKNYFQNTLVVNQSLFNDGFADYALNGYLGLSVDPGLQIDVARPVYQLSNTSLATGQAAAGAYTIVLPALYAQVRGGDTISQRAGASLTLAASVYPALYNGNGGPITIGTGASITVDPRQSITVEGYGQITDLGTLTAHGGTITIANTRFEATPTNNPGNLSNYAPGLSVWIGDGALVDVSGAAETMTDALGRRYGFAQSGGAIYLGGLGGLSDASPESTYAQVIVRPGAVLNASGAAATVDVSAGFTPQEIVPLRRPATLAGNGGLIAARSYDGIAFDGTLLAAGAGTNAAGGTLAIRLDPQDLADFSNLPQAYDAPSQILISQNFIPVQTQAGLAPDSMVTDPATIGLARISQQQITQGGFDTLDLAAQDVIALDGAVSLKLGRSVTLETGILGETQANVAASITAPYVDLIGYSSSNNFQGGIDPYGTAGEVQTPSLTTSTLTINAALIDIGNSIDLGGTKALAGNNPAFATPETASTYGFSQTNFFSSGDIRFTGDVGGQQAGILASSGNITFRAAQLYPVSGAPDLVVNEQVVAGLNPNAGSGVNELAGGTITVLGLGGPAPAVPYSVGGTLALFADTVVQDGIIRAPEGNIEIGEPLGSGSTQVLLTDTVTLGANSITSVSLDGLSVPYGGTVDGVNYLYDGEAVTAFNPIIQLGGVNIAVQSGATIDISGGGTLAGAGFIAGRGGSTDVNKTPLLNSRSGTVTANTSDPIFAIVPGYASQYAPQAPVDAGYSAPSAGEQITIAAGEVAGLAAGTYTLLPAYYDLLPGAFRVEFTAGSLAQGTSTPFGNYTTVAAVTVGTANTGIAGSLPTAALITPASGVRQLSQYDEENYSTFEINSAATFDQPRPALPQDAKTLLIQLSQPDTVSATGSGTASGSTSVGASTTGTPSYGSLVIAAGVLDQAPAPGGYGGTGEIISQSAIELLAPTGPGATLTQLSAGPGELTTQPTIGIDAAMLSALNLPRLLVGGTLTSDSAVGTANLISVAGISPAVAVNQGATLAAGDIMLVAKPSGGSISVSDGATLTTLGEPTSAAGLAQGFYFSTDSNANGASPLLGISNGQIVFATNVTQANGAAISVAPGAVIEGAGSLNFVAPEGTSVNIGQATFAAGFVDVQVADINIGSQADLNAFANLLPGGLTLTDATLNALAADTSVLILSAQQAVNIIGSVAVDSKTTDLVLNTPAIYGYGVTTSGTTTTTTIVGGASTTTQSTASTQDVGVASITAPNLTWGGVLSSNVVSGQETLTASVTPGGRLAGSGAVSSTSTSSVNGTTTQVAENDTLTLTDAQALDINATKTLDLGYGPNSQIDDQVSLARLAVGYQNVTLSAGSEITANAESSLTVYQDVAQFGKAGTGGNLALVSPLITGESGAVLGLTAGNNFTANNAGAAGGATASVATLGAEIDIIAASVDTSTAFALPAGKLSITTQGNIDLASGTNIDLSGRATKLFDQTVETSGGTLILQAYAGDGGSISEDVGANINVSSLAADAGSVTAVASGGTVAFNGNLAGTAASNQTAGSFTVFAGTLTTASTTQSAFDALNTTLNQGGFSGGRVFELATGDITVDQTIVAHKVSIGADSGSIDVAGTINASGASPGSISLSAANTLTLESTALLDAHATTTARDSYGEEIDADNRAHVTLTSSNGTVVLDPGAAINVSYPDASNLQGQVVINAPRQAGSLVDVAVQATGPVTITGAASIDLYAFRTYTPNSGGGTANVNGTIVQDNGLGSSAGNAVTTTGTIGLVQINADSAAYINTVDTDAASAGDPLALQLAGLAHYGSNFNLLPGVIIASTGAGSLTITGDLDLSGFRYTDPKLFGIGTTATLGSGEPGSIVFRSANNLVINGSVSDGFALPPDTTNGTLISADTNGWELLAPGFGGFETTNQDLLLPQGALAVFKTKTGTSTSSTIYLIGNTSETNDTIFDTTRPISLNYNIVVDPVDLLANVTIPFSLTIGEPSSPIPTGGWVATSAITRNGVVLYNAGQLIPAGFTFQTGDVLAAGAVLPISVQTGVQTGSVGQLIPAGTPFTIFGDGTLYLAQNVALPANALIPALTELFFGAEAAGSTKVVPVTEVAYRQASDQFGGTTPVEGYLFPLAALLPAGDQSWSLSFVSGANLGAASTNAVQPLTTLYGGAFVPPALLTNQAPGSLLIDDEHEFINSANYSNVEPAFSVIRTGTGDLSLIAGGDVDQSSLYGIYTAGTQDPLGNGQDAQFNTARQPEGNGTNLLPGNKTLSALIASTYQAYYPNDGGDFLLAAQGDVTSATFAAGNNFQSTLPPSDLVGNWLWRQGSTQLGQPTAWWINFGTLNVPLDNGVVNANVVALTGFTGFGALGGGNVTVAIGGNAGQSTDRDEGLQSGVNGGPGNSAGEGLVIAEGGTGRLLPGATDPITTGGGNIVITIGGALNPLNAGAYEEGATVGSVGTSGESPSVNGDVIDLRGNITITAGAIGRVDYQFDIGNANLFDPRALDPFTADNGVPNGGIEIIPGDGTVSITTDRDLVVAGVADPGRISEQSLTSLAAYTSDLGSDANGGGYTGFSLWQPTTSVSLFSSGGNVTPTTLANQTLVNGEVFNNAPTDFRQVYPATLLVTAATGDIIYGQDGAPPGTASGYGKYSLETAPAPNGQVAFLAGGSIFANGYAIDLSGANPAGLSLPTDPAFTSFAAGGATSAGLSNILTGIGTNPTPLALFALEPDTPTTNVHANDPDPARFYAAGGDIVNFQTGETIYFGGNSTEAQSEWYIAAKPVWIIASNDIVSSGTRPSVDPNATIFATQENQQEDTFPDAFASGGNVAYYSSGNLFLNNSTQSVSLIQAGRDILSTYAYVGGPGLLQVSAGRNLYQAADTSGTAQVLAFGSFKSLGDNLILGSQLSTSAGAGIDVLAGVGAAGPDYTAFANLYFNPSDQANLALPITSAANAGKVQQVYATELTAWLAANYGYTGTAKNALAAFLALPAIDQGIFVRQVYFEELAASGAQETNPNSRFYKSYVRGRQAIDTLFPSTGKQITPGVPVGYTGAITMYSGTALSGSNPIDTPAGTPATFDGGIATLFGGTVQVLDPGGAATFGISGGPAPGNSSGIVTYGAGDVDVYALGSVALGQSRIFTTGGGNLLIWSSSGDINAGIGASTTVVYNPPELLYSNLGDITETPPADSSGAGIATLQPLPNVPAGDVSLIAPGGTIDPGEAGVRVSGNLTLAAARVVTTNISVKGATAGAPTVSVASLGAIEAGNASTGAAASAAESQSNRSTEAGDAASVVEVEVISIGGSYDEEQKRKKRGL